LGESQPAATPGLPTLRMIRAFDDIPQIFSQENVAASIRLNKSIKIQRN
jgi:hypothetical protein